jgi:hypothetical protein
MQAGNQNSPRTLCSRSSSTNGPTTEYMQQPPRPEMILFDSTETWISWRYLLLFGINLTHDRNPHIMPCAVVHQDTHVHMLNLQLTAPQRRPKGKDLPLPTTHVRVQPGSGELACQLEHLLPDSNIPYDFLITSMWYVICISAWWHKGKW